MEFEKVEPYITQRMQRELSSNLCYHSLWHTRGEVVPAVKKFAGLEGIQGLPLKLLLTAAWFHDIGYVIQPLYHELISVRIAQEVLPDFGYSPSHIDVIRWAILATALPQAPRGRLEEVLVDADLDVLGSETFINRNKDLRAELASLGKSYDDVTWYENQLKFIENHHYFTPSAHALNDSRKLVNIAELHKILAGVSVA